jgi:hypothetical protein
MPVHIFLSNGDLLQPSGQQKPHACPVCCIMSHLEQSLGLRRMISNTASLNAFHKPPFLPAYCTVSADGSPANREEEGDVVQELFRVFGLSLLFALIPHVLNLVLQVDGCYHGLFGGRHHESLRLFSNPDDESRYCTLIVTNRGSSSASKMCFSMLLKHLIHGIPLRSRQSFYCFW